MIKKISIFTALLTVAAILFMPNHSNIAYASETLAALKPIHIYTFDNDTDTTVVDAVTESAIIHHYT